MGLGRTTVVLQGTEDLRYLNAARWHDIGRPGCKALDTRMAISAKQVEVVCCDFAVEVVCCDVANVFYFRPDRRLVASDQAPVESEGSEEVTVEGVLGAVINARVIYATAVIGAIAGDSAVSEREVPGVVKYAAANIGRIARGGTVLDGEGAKIKHAATKRGRIT